MAAAPAPATQEEAAPSLLKGMANLSFWMIGIAFGCYNLVAMAIVSFYPTFLELVRGYSLTYDNGVLMHASFVTAFIFGASIFTGPGGGQEASIHRDRHVCGNFWPEYRDVYQRSAFPPDSGGSGMGGRGVLDDSYMPNRHYCNLIYQGSIKTRHFQGLSGFPGPWPRPGIKIKLFIILVSEKSR